MTGQCIFCFRIKVTFSLVLMVDRLTVLLTRFFSISTLLSALSSRIPFSLSRRSLPNNSQPMSKIPGPQLSLKSSPVSDQHSPIFFFHLIEDFHVLSADFFSDLSLQQQTKCRFTNHLLSQHTDKAESCTACLVFTFT